MRIFKYKLSVEDSVSVEMPVGAKVLSVGVQNVNEIFVWALVDDKSKKMEDRVFCIFGTGHEVPIDFSLVFVGTVHMDLSPFPGNLVWHIFEKLTRR